MIAGHDPYCPICRGILKGDVPPARELKVTDQPDSVERLKQVVAEWRRVGCLPDYHVSPGIAASGTVEIGCACWICDKIDAALALFAAERERYAKLEAQLLDRIEALNDGHAELTIEMRDQIAKLEAENANLRAVLRRLREEP